LLIVHGMNEHIGRYGNFARHFADRFILKTAVGACGSRSC
jgi:hypothetical protein